MVNAHAGILLVHCLKTAVLVACLKNQWLLMLIYRSAAAHAQRLAEGGLVVEPSVLSDNDYQIVERNPVPQNMTVDKAFKEMISTRPSRRI